MLAWDEKYYVEIAKMTPEAARALIQSRQQKTTDNANAQLAIRGASNPQPGQSFDVMVDRSSIYSQIDETASDGTQRRIQEIRLNNIVRMLARGEA